MPPDAQQHGPSEPSDSFDALRTCMLGLVLINVLFVQLTEAAELAWLMPLYLLTLLAPVLNPLRKWLAYRLAWNLAVMGLFSLLVSHAAGNDLRFVLQDGLLLAALCQVHLLNNLGRDQRPDLLFLNSFLIAVATGYLCQDLAYPVAFLLYVPLFVVGLQLMSIMRQGGALDGFATRRVVLDGLRRSGMLLAATMGIFLFWPRDFQRSSFFVGEFDFTSPSGAADVGFSEKLKLRKRGDVRVSDRVVMSVTLIEGQLFDVPSLWRGATLDTTDGREWWSSESEDLTLARHVEDEWVQRGAQMVRATADERFNTRLAVELVDAQPGRLFAPLLAERLVPGAGIHVDRILPSAGGVLTFGDRHESRGGVRYEIAYAAEDEEPTQATDAWAEGTLSRYVALPVSRRIDSARNIAERLASDMPDGASQREMVTAFSYYLERQYAYLPPGAEGAAETLDQFLTAAAGGHCELFASALATMLRSRQIPCRVVTGYRSAEWDTDLGVLTFRSRGAHAWVEVHDPATGWYTVDPNPAPAVSRGPGLWARMRTGFSELWGRLTSFDADGRVGVVAWLRATPERCWAWARANPGAALSMGGALAACFALLRLRRRHGVAPELLAYRRALQRARLRSVPGETPRELLVRAQGTDLPLARMQALVAATGAHERARYAAST